MENKMEYSFWVKITDYFRSRYGGVITYNKIEYKGSTKIYALNILASLILQIL